MGQIAGETRVHTLGDITNTDLTAARNEYLFETPFLSAVLKRFLKDERDEPMAHLLLNITLWFVVFVPATYAAALSTTLPRWCCHASGFLCLLGNLALLTPRFILMLHYSSHRSVFDAAALQGYISWVLAPFFGVPCGVYRAHHCIMHHIENNHGMDTSATDFYQRDSIPHFICYWLRFFVLIHVELPLYCVKSKRWAVLKEILFGQTVWYLLLALVWRISPAATAWVFLVPYTVTMFLFSFGNFSQHIFVDPDRYDNNYALTYNCISAPANQKTFNDGYHIIHHANARLHWSEMPAAFHASIDKHRDQGALTFRTLDFFEVGALVLTGQLRKLAAEYYVHLGDKESAPTVAEMEAKFRAWLKPVKYAAAPAVGAAAMARGGGDKKAE